MQVGEKMSLIGCVLKPTHIETTGAQHVFSILHGTMTPNDELSRYFRLG
jgi:hypothetical protein